MNLIPDDLRAFIAAQPPAEWIGMALVLLLFGSLILAFAVITP